MVRRFFDRYKVIIVWIMVIGFFLGAAGLAAFQYMRPSSSRDSATGGEDQSVAIKVDGNSISENQFDQAYENAIRQQEQVYSQYDRDFSKMLEGAQGALQKLRIKASVAESLIQNELMRQEAETRGIEPSQEKVNQQFNQQVDQLLEERDWTREDLENALASQDLSYSDFEKESKENIRQNLQTEELQNQIIGDVDPSDSELETFFQDNLSDYAQTPSQVKASHVVLESQTQANQILEKVEGGTSFQALAEEEMEDPDLGWFTEEDQPGPIAETAFNLEPGEVSDPIETPDGWEILKVLDKKEPQHPPFEEIKDQVQSDYKKDKEQERFQEWYEEVREEAKVEIQLPLVDAQMKAEEDTDEGLAAFKALTDQADTTDPYLTYYIGQLYEQKMQSLNEELEEEGEEDSQTQEQVDEYREKAVDYYMQAVENQRDSDPKLLENVVNLTRGSTEVDPEVHYQLATNLAEQKRYQRAITQFEQAIEKNSEYTEAYLGFGDVLSKLDNYSQAIEQYKKALELKEDDPQLLIKMGQAYLPDGQYSEARESFEKALELHEDNFGALKGLGDLAAEQGDYEKAIEYYTEALAQKDDTETKLSLGDAYLEAEQFDDAKETFKQLTVNSPYNGRAYLGLGKVYQAEGDSSRALSNYNDGLARSGDEKLREQLSKRIVELDPEDLGTRFTLAQSYQDQHIYDSAIEQYRTIIDRTDNETNLRDAFQGLGDSYMSKTDYKKAQEFYQKGLEHAGQARNKLPFYEGILEANESIHGEEELTENGLEALFQIGKIQVRQGETEEAREKLTRLQELDSEYQTEEVEELLSEIEPEVEETTTTVGD